MKRFFEEGTLHCNYVSNQFPLRIVTIQNLAIEMCAGVHVTFLYRHMHRACVT